VDSRQSNQPLLTPDQLSAILDDAEEPIGAENHGQEANDPSAN